MTAEQEGQRRVRVNGRVVGIVLVLLVVIAGAVVGADVLSKRDRNPIQPPAKLPR